MKTSHGIIQGYVGVSAVDSKNQIIISAEAFGQWQEHDLLEPIVQEAKEHLGKHYIEKAKLTTDSGFHNKKMSSFVRKKTLMRTSPIKVFDQETLALKITNGLK